MAIAFNVFAQGEGDRIVNPTWKLSSGALTPTVSTWTLMLPATTFTENILLPASAYFNFGATAGTSGYGIRDNAGTIQYKNSGNVWTTIPTSLSGGGWTLGASKVYPTTANTKGHVRTVAGDTTETGLWNVYGNLNVTNNISGSLDSAGVVGLYWNKTSDTYIRLGTAKNKTQSYFVNIAPFNQLRRCNLSDAGLVNAYYGDAGYIEDGSNGQVMVEIPKFWYKVDILTTGYKWFVSSIPRSGFRLHPMFIRNSIEKDYVYIGAFEGSVYDVTASATEVNTITVTSALVTASGNITITLDGNYKFTVAVVLNDNAATVAGKIRAAGNKTDYQGVLWTVSGATTDVIYTSSASGLKTTVDFTDIGTTGVTVTIVKTTSGAGGYVLNDASGVSFVATTGDVLSSVASIKPVSGWKNSLTIVNTRVLARNRGTGWEQQDYLTTCGLQLLYLIEYGGFNTQTLLSAGVTNVTDDALTNMSINTGYTGSKSGGTQLGNASGEVTVTHYQTAQTTKSFSFHGVENFYGNLWKFVDGINIANNVLWFADNGFVSDQFSTPYVNTGLTLHNANGYATDIKVNNNYKYQFLASVVGGSSSTYLTDYYYQATGNRIALFGGGWSTGGAAGGFHWDLNGASGSVGRALGGRLLKF